MKSCSVRSFGDVRFRMFSIFCLSLLSFTLAGCPVGTQWCLDLILCFLFIPISHHHQFVTVNPLRWTMSGRHSRFGSLVQAGAPRVLTGSVAPNESAARPKRLPSQCPRPVRH